MASTDEAPRINDNPQSVAASPVPTPIPIPVAPRRDIDKTPTGAALIEPAAASPIILSERELKLESTLHTSRQQALSTALSQWKISGVNADYDSLALLKNILDEDKALFASDDSSTWQQIKEARDILDAESISFSPDTAKRLSVYVDSNINSAANLQINSQISDELRRAGLKTVPDKEHAAIIFTLDHNFISSDSNSNDDYQRIIIRSVASGSAAYNVGNGVAFFSKNYIGTGYGRDYSKNNDIYNVILESNRCVAIKFAQLAFPSYKAATCQAVPH